MKRKRVEKPKMYGEYRRIMEVHVHSSSQPVLQLGKFAKTCELIGCCCRSSTCFPHLTFLGRAVFLGITSL
jgi:hypothetical protein